VVKEAFSDVEWKQVTDIHVKEKSVRIRVGNRWGKIGVEFKF
jgi:hypothetical protein